MFSSNIYEGTSNMFEMTSSERNNGYDTKSGTEMDAPSDDDQGPRRQRSKTKNYHRHTQRQIQEMEALFKACPHPDDKQRQQLSRDLGLEPLQIKFWFQNKRTQMKAHQEHHENSILKAENERLRAENNRYKDALSNVSCPTCGGPAALGEMSFDEQHLRIENSRLREELVRLSGGGKHLTTSFPRLSGGGGDLQRSFSVPTEADKPMIIELAVAAMEELMRKAQSAEPLWISGEDSIDVLNEDEYFRTFPRTTGSKPLGLRSEASREYAIVFMNHVSLVETLMDVDQWSKVFCGIVSRAVTLEKLSTGVAGNYDGALQVMTAEFQVPSPLVPTRENYFVRYCKHHDDGTWAVVDVSLDNLHPTPISKCIRRPSGCLIQELPNGFSKVIWIEHVEMDDRGVHEMYRPLTHSGLAFGAKRWVATLDRQCERIATSIASNIHAGDLCVITSPEGRKSMLKLAERLVTSFCNGVGASTALDWTIFSATCSDDVRVMTRQSIDDPGRPPGIVLSAATSFWMPVSPKRVFDFLRDGNSRCAWDILSNGGSPQEMAHITNGRDPGNRVSLIRSGNTNQSNMLILQESCSDATGSYVIYAPVDVVAMNLALSGGDPNYVALLPSGFAILPDGSGHNGGSGGSLLTLAFQILVDSIPSAKLSIGSVTNVNSLIKCTIEKIRTAVMCGSA